MGHKKIISSFGEYIRSLREAQSLSLRDVANKLGLDSSLLGKIELNKRQPTKEQIKIIAVFYQLDEKELISEILSDQLAYKIMEADADVEILKVAEQKIKYLKQKKII